jgi:hypothetical protein|eukprot:2343066-Prymnesium_polylepis.1
MHDPNRTRESIVPGARGRVYAHSECYGSVLSLGPRIYARRRHMAALGVWSSPVCMCVCVASRRRVGQGGRRYETVTVSFRTPPVSLTTAFVSR